MHDTILHTHHTEIESHEMRGDNYCYTVSDSWSYLHVLTVARVETGGRDCLTVHQHGQEWPELSAHN